ncbi:MAG: Glu-tRNA(Gln) amidotransferase subunit GatE [Conexivisphaerales archaeon]
MSTIDPEKINLKVGLEIHRQLRSSAKLFCSCPPVKEEEGKTFRRRFRPSESELGEVDPAALFEAKKGLWISYVAGRESSCLVEADEEPPHDINKHALETAIMVCRILNSEVVDEIQVMRKMVIDGSNTTGFQRTMVVGIGGSFRVKGKEIGVQTVTLEEDAARILDSNAGERRFSLDRLGIPLIEVSLEPVTASPKAIQEIALALGRLLKATGRMEKGLGSVRQDINISVMNGEIIEVKGVQQLDLVSRVVQFEAERQLWLRELARIMKDRGLKNGFMDEQIVDVSSIFSDTASKIIISGIKRGEKVLAVKVKGMKGLLSLEPKPNMRLGKELADIARFYTLGGLFHSDELPSYGISKDEVTRVRGVLQCRDEDDNDNNDNDGHHHHYYGDAFILVVGEENRARLCMQALCRRLEQALLGPPAETRAATDEGETRFIRPRPGSARMYPETDIPPIPITDELITRIDKLIPPSWDEQVEQLKKKYGLKDEQAEKILDSDYLELFNTVCSSSSLQPSFVASLLTEGLVSLRREGIDVAAKIKDATLLDLFEMLSKGEVAKEVSLDMLRSIAKGESKDLKEAMQKLGVQRLSREDLSSLVREIVRQEKEIIHERRERAFSALMGMVMQKVRGRVDGSLVSSELRKAIEEELKNIDN